MKKKKYLKTNPNFVTVFRKSAIRASALRMKSMADKLAKDVRDVLYKQLYNWPPLSPKYLAMKERTGLDTRILIASGKYVRSIKSIRTVDEDKGVMYSVGPVGKTANKIPLTLLARWLEYGTTKMPAREHWRPAWSIFLSKVSNTKKKLKTEILREFGKNIKSKNKTKVTTRR